MLNVFTVLLSDIFQMSPFANTAISDRLVRLSALHFLHYMIQLVEFPGALLHRLIYRIQVRTINRTRRGFSVYTPSTAERVMCGAPC